MFIVNWRSPMSHRRYRFPLSIAFWIVWIVSLNGNAQESKKATAAPHDHSGEAYVIEERVQRWTFENDGTGIRETTARVRIQSGAGVEHFGVLTFPYESAVESVEIGYVRVRKPDGSVIPTTLDEVQDLPTPVTREAPLYSDLHEKQLAVKGLGVGDLLEYQCRWNMTKPLIPGQFWMHAGFDRDQVIQEEKIVVRTPRNRAIKSKGSLAPVITDEGDYRTYTWSRSNLESQQIPESDLTIFTVHGTFPAPDVELSSFQTWQEIGLWYGGLQQERVAPSAEVRAKAAELTRNAADDSAKIQAIYKYVSTQYRYIGVDFGIGRYQPHFATEVLNNQYGDCKDKHTLLASLLAAAGIPAYAALINSSHAIDPDVPSPAQFDHVITAVPRGKDLLWLDTTTEVGPFGYLVLPLRDKQALVIFPDKPAAFQMTPQNPPFPTSWTYKINARLDESGTLEGKVEQTLRGDLEVLWRSVFRRLSRSGWKEAIQRFSYATGFSGEVSEVTVSLPEATETPLQFSYTYRRKHYPDWENHRISPPAPIAFTMPMEQDGKLPQRFWLSAPGEIEFDSRVELPKEYRPLLPSNKDLKQDFGEYHSAYSFEGNTLIAHYDMLIKIAEVAGSAVSDYRAMAEKVMKDRTQFIPLEPQAQGPARAVENLFIQLWQLPDSADAKAMQSEQDARTAFDRHSMPEGIRALEKAVAQDPKFTRGWLLLGQMKMYSWQHEGGIEALRHAVAVDPTQPLPYKFLGFALASLGERKEALQVWQDLAKIAPEDREALANLGTMLVAEKRFSDSLPYLEKMVKLYPENGHWRMAVAGSYLNTNQEAKATEAFEKALQLQPTPETNNNVAYVLAEANQRLDDALHYAETAVHLEEDASRKVQLNKLAVDDLNPTRNLGTYWDTLGWVQYHRGNLKQAEGYVFAAWLLGQQPVVGYHLAQIYEKEQRKPDAVHMYRLVASISEGGLAAEDLDAIAYAKKHLGTPAQSGQRMVFMRDDPGGEMSQDRSISLPKLVSKQASAEFFLSFAPDSKTEATTKAGAGPAREAIVEDAAFISGSDLLRSAGETLRRSHFKVAFPEGSDSRLVRRGVLACYPTGCTFVLIPPDSVKQVN